MQGPKEEIHPAYHHVNSSLNGLLSGGSGLMTIWCVRRLSCRFVEVMLAVNLLCGVSVQLSYVGVFCAVH